MLYTLYNKYLAKDKILRHYTQHFLVSVVGYSITVLLFPLPFSFSSVFIYFICTYIIDIDGVIALFTTAKNIPESVMIRTKLRRLDFQGAGLFATQHHKKINRLILHNIFGFIAIVCITAYAAITSKTTLLLITSPIFFHFLFDIWDDYYQLGHLNNWLWPIQKR